MNPRAKLITIRDHLRNVLQYPISKETTRKYLVKMGWSWKVPSRFQIYKYNISNMIRYIDYIEEIQQIPFHRLKFFDESHFIPKKLTARKILGMKSSRVYLKEKTLNELHASMSILTSSCGTPVIFDYRIKSNTQWDFADFVLFLCEEGYLVAGDYLVMDNASIHTAYTSSKVLKDVLEIFQVTLIFLPAYSPELNPCELVFNVIKQYIRNRDVQDNTLENVYKAVSSITVDHMVSFYRHCIFPKIVLPEIHFN